MEPPRTTLRRLARETGYSIATISRALNRRDGVRSEVARAIIDAARRSGYRECGETIAVVTPSLGFRNYADRLLPELQKAFRDTGYFLEVLPLDSLPLIEEQRLAGAISLMVENGLERYWGEREIIPLVCVNSRPRHLEGIYSVVSHEAGGMRLAWETLYRAGHRKIALFGQRAAYETAENWCVSQRVEAFRNLAAAAGEDSSLVVLMGEALPDAVLPVRRALEGGVTAFIAFGEAYAPVLLYALRVLGVRVPEEVSVVSWETPGVSPYLSPAVTSVEQDLESVARRSAALLLGLLAGKSPEGDIEVEYRFLPRESVAPPPPSR